MLAPLKRTRSCASEKVRAGTLDCCRLQHTPPAVGGNHRASPACILHAIRAGPAWLVGQSGRGRKPGLEWLTPFEVGEWGEPQTGGEPLHLRSESPPHSICQVCLQGVFLAAHVQPVALARRHQSTGGQIRVVPSEDYSHAPPRCCLHKPSAGRRDEDVPPFKKKAYEDKQYIKSSWSRDSEPR